MRIASMIIGLILLVPMTLQTFTVFWLGDAFNEEAMAQAGAVGVLAALIWLIASAVAIPAPRGSAVLFAVAGALALLVSGDFPDMRIWGAVALGLAVMSYVGHRQKRSAELAQAAKEAKIEAEMAELRRMAVSARH